MYRGQIERGKREFLLVFSSFYCQYVNFGNFSLADGTSAPHI
jgi:hypothetical protein